jgi:hypothetical protein
MRLAEALQEMVSLAPVDPPPAAAMALPQAARLALLDKMLSREDGCSRQEIADRLFGGQIRSVARYNDHLRRLGGEPVYDKIEGGFYHSKPFYFGAVILRPASFHYLDQAIERTEGRADLADLQIIRKRLREGLEVAASNHCFESFASWSVGIRAALDRLHANQQPSLRVTEQPVGSEYLMAA